MSATLETGSLPAAWERAWLMIMHALGVDAWRVAWRLFWRCAWERKEPTSAPKSGEVAHRPGTLNGFCGAVLRSRCWTTAEIPPPTPPTPPPSLPLFLRIPLTPIAITETRFLAFIFFFFALDGHARRASERVGTRVDRHAVTLAIRAGAARGRVARGTGVQARVTADSLCDGAFCAIRIAGRRAGGRVNGSGRPDDWGDGHVDGAMHVHTRWSGGLGEQVRRRTSNTFQPDFHSLGHFFPSRLFFVFSRPPITPATPGLTTRPQQVPSSPRDKEPRTAQEIELPLWGLRFLPGSN